MAGIKNLGRLLNEMKPEMAKPEFVFCSITESKFGRLKIKPLMAFKEKEGITLILEKKVADDNFLLYSRVWRMVILAVHSDLSAVGFLSAITKKLADAGICVNIVSAYNHDYLFIPVEKAGNAIKELKSLGKKV